MASENAGSTAGDASRFTRDAESVISRVHGLSTLFVGVGLFAAAGLAMGQMGTFADLRLTYFAVGTVVGVVGLLLWIVTR